MRIIHIQGLYSNHLLNVITEKDSVIQFLSDSLNDLGASKIIKNFAPKHSINYEVMNKYNDQFNLSNVSLNNDIIMKTAQKMIDTYPLAKLGNQKKKEIKSEFKRNSPDFDPNSSFEINHLNNNNIGNKAVEKEDDDETDTSFMTDESKETLKRPKYASTEDLSQVKSDSNDLSLPADSEEDQVKSREVSGTPSPKKRKFGKVRAVKREQ